MPMKLLDGDAFRAAAKDGQTPEGTLFKFATAEAEQVGDEAARTQRFVFSDATVDHSDDSIDPKGWKLDIFKRNPVTLFSHMSWDPPIGRASNVSVQNDQLVGDIEFASADVYDFADTIYRLVKGKFLKAVSVGFKPDEWAFTNDKNRPYGIDFKKQTLLEISVCPVPCNPNALGEARSLGVDTRPLQEWAEKVLDSGDVVFMPRQDLETLRGQAGAPERRYYIQLDSPLPEKAAERVRDAVKRWQRDASEVLILPPGVTLRTADGEITHRASEDWKCGASRDLPIDEDAGWDGPAAEASIFEHAGGDDFDPAVARTGFLAYDASAPKLRGSYKLPFATVSDGKLTAMASGIRAAASRLPQTDIPDATKGEAKAVLDHYEAAMKKSAPLEARAGRRISAATKAKMQQALDMADQHHEAMTKCITEAMGADQNDPGDPDDGAQDADAPAEFPPGSVVPDADKDADLTPAERRLKEARALRATLPTND